ncbi:hypothetical protein [Nodosilinea sp. E11]|uniref:hypothetical protein n=1 Tax=Nodosilinea sp. E11 TaxID=3037479 RepID=UPI002934E0BC|nr:hypothetical protein [Nodosilinea sp. E11]WOD37064.1 hypothetical protein RRF56_00990 [Nodosilinea sp. E11]
MPPDFTDRSREASAVIWLGLILFGNAFAQKLSEIIAVSSFLSDVGVNQIIWVWMIDGFLMLLVTGLQSLIIDHHSRRKIMEYIVLALTFSFILLQAIRSVDGPNWLSQSLLFLLSQQQWLTFTLVFWVFANDMLGIAQSKKFMPKISSFGFAGYALGIIAVGITSLSMQRLSIPHDVMLNLCLAVNAGIYSCIFLVLRFKLSQFKVRPTLLVSEPFQKNLIEGWNFIREIDLFRYLATAVLAIVICETILDFCFFQTSFSAFPDFYQYQVFQSIYLIIRAILEGVISQFIAQIVITDYGLKSVFMIQPVFSFLASGIMYFIPTFLGGLVGIFLQKSIQYGIDEPARKALEGIVPQEKRGRVSNFIDGYMIGLGGILGSLIIALFMVLGWAVGFDIIKSNLYLSGALISSLIAIFATRKMSKTYNTSLLDWRLHRRNRGNSVLDNLDL